MVINTIDDMVNTVEGINNTDQRNRFTKGVTLLRMSIFMWNIVKECIADGVEYMSDGSADDFVTYLNTHSFYEAMCILDALEMIKYNSSDHNIRECMSKLYSDIAHKCGFEEESYQQYIAKWK